MELGSFLNLESLDDAQSERSTILPLIQAKNVILGDIFLFEDRACKVLTILKRSDPMVTWVGEDIFDKSIHTKSTKRSKDVAKVIADRAKYHVVNCFTLVL